MADDLAPSAAEEDPLLRLLREARADNAAALNQLLAEIRPFLKEKVEQFRRDQNFRHWDGSDVVQASLLNVADHLDDVQATTSAQFRAWL